jgi:hypothetical protein
MSSRTDLGVAPINNKPISETKKKSAKSQNKTCQNIKKCLKFKGFVQNSKTNRSHTNYCRKKIRKKKKRKGGAQENFDFFTFMASKKLNSVNKSSMKSAGPSHSWCPHAPLCWKFWQES